MFTGFKPSGMEKIANRLGYKGNMMNFDSYLEQNPDKKRQMLVFEDAARKMAAGGYVKMQEGGLNLGPQVVVTGPDGTQYGNPQIAERAGVTDYTMTQPAKMEEFPTPAVEIPEVTTPVMPPPVTPITTDDVLDPSKGTGTTTPYPQDLEDTSNPFTERHNKTKEKIDRGEIIKPNEGEIKIDNNFYRSPEYRQAMYDFTDPMKFAGKP